MKKKDKKSPELTLKEQKQSMYLAIIYTRMALEETVKMLEDLEYMWRVEVSRK